MCCKGEAITQCRTGSILFSEESKVKILKEDYKYSSKLELLEIYYILSLIEHYLQHPTYNPKIKGKRGKDFIYSLVHNISPQAVSNYKAQIQASAKHEGSMQQLFSQLITSEKYALVFKSALAQNGQSFILVTEKDGGDSKEAETRKKSEDELIKLFNLADFEVFPGFELDFKLSAPVFSPSALSAGVSTVIARAHRAACFKDLGFSDAAAEVEGLRCGNEKEEGEMVGESAEAKSSSERAESYKVTLDELSGSEYYEVQLLS
eukprot:TRINITY_DN1819_c0_g2_i2.p1 TRINITY_DN1819_c0_g2~~TRINITY_DN1819_c0_g2_i2.p1  ORF type:complete len:263 (+),score=39.23 TRINITY_DN1819_c0_g2_i2:447-1235(+)